MKTHGHVTPNADGSRARRSGPAICSVCALELAQKERETTGHGEAVKDIIERLDREQARMAAAISIADYLRKDTRAEILALRTRVATLERALSCIHIQKNEGSDDFTITLTTPDDDDKTILAVHTYYAPETALRIAEQVRDLIVAASGRTT